MRKYKAVIIGCGARGNDHCNAYAQIENAELAACFDLNPERRQNLAEKYKIRQYGSAEEMIDKEAPDIVHITTYPAVRLKLMLLVSKLGVPLCVTEKPLASGVSDWRILTELEGTSKTKFAVSHQFRWHKHLSRCREALENGTLGQVLFLDLSAGMNISGQGTHTLNYGMSLNRDIPVSRVFGNAAGWDRNDKGHPAPSTSEAMLTFANGVRALWTSGSVSPRTGRADAFWEHVRIAAYAEKGRVNYEEFGKWEIISATSSESGNFGGPDEWRRNNLAAQSEFHKAMFLWLEDDSKIPGTNLRQSLHEWAVVLALYQSSLERMPVEMKDFNPPDDIIEQYKRKVL